MWQLPVLACRQTMEAPDPPDSSYQMRAPGSCAITSCYFDRMPSEVECVVKGRDLLGECPLWDEREGVLWWVDILAPALKRFDTSVKTYPLPEAMGSFAFREEGGLLAAMKSGIYLYDRGANERERIA